MCLLFNSVTEAAWLKEIDQGSRSSTYMSLSGSGLEGEKEESQRDEVVAAALLLGSTKKSVSFGSAWLYVHSSKGCPFVHGFSNVGCGPPVHVGSHVLQVTG